MRWLIPLKYKVVFPIVVGIAGTAVLYRAITAKELDREASRSGLERAQLLADSLREELETSLKSRLFELQGISAALQQDPHAPVFSTCSTDFRNEVLGITQFSPNRDGTYSARYTANTWLLAKRKLPLTALALINKETSIDIKGFAKRRETALINRSFTTTENQNVGVYSFLAFSKSLDGHPEASVIVADAIQEPFASRLGARENALAYLVNAKGHLVSHPELEILTEFKAQPFDAFPTEALPKDWTHGVRFEWNKGGTPVTSAALPTGISDVYIYTETPKSAFQPVIAAIQKEFLLGAYSILGLCLALGLLVSRGLTRNIRNTAAVSDCIARGELDRVPAISGRDEFRHVDEAFSRLLPSVRERFREEFERGQKDSLLATAQTVRAMMANPAPGILEQWDLTTFRPTLTPTHQDFWDFHSHGSRRQIILGRSSADGVSGILLAVLVRSTLDNARKISGRFSSQRALTLAETLEVLNSAVHAAFKGRVSFLATACEFDLDSGAYTWINAGGATPVKWHQKSGQTSALDDRSLSTPNSALGSEAKIQLNETTGVLAEGERVFIHTPSVMANGHAEDIARSTVLLALQRSNDKSLPEVKTAICEAIANRPFEPNLVFIAFGRPESASAQTDVLAA
jgi:HAMP domain-containing protein